MDIGAKLIIRAGLSGRMGEELPLTQDVFTIGRATSCQLPLDISFASRRHVQIVRREQSYWLRELGSKNGTLLDNQPVTNEQLLEDGAEIRIGEVVLRFVDPSITRTHPGMATTSASLWIDRHSREVWLHGEPLQPHLSVKQFALLLCLYDRIGEVVSKDEIARAAWPEVAEGEVFDYQVDKMVSRVRERIGKETIETVWGYGYRLQCQVLK